MKGRARWVQERWHARGRAPSRRCGTAVCGGLATLWPAVSACGGRPSRKHLRRVGCFGPLGSACGGRASWQRLWRAGLPAAPAAGGRFRVVAPAAGGPLDSACGELASWQRLRRAGVFGLYSRQTRPLARPPKGTQKSLDAYVEGRRRRVTTVFCGAGLGEADEVRGALKHQPHHLLLHAVGPLQLRRVVSTQAFEEGLRLSKSMPHWAMPQARARGGDHSRAQARSSSSSSRRARQSRGRTLVSGHVDALNR